MAQFRHNEKGIDPVPLGKWRFTVRQLSLRKAYASDSEFVFAVKEAAFREYVEQIWGWDDSYQRQLHNRRFAAQDFRIIQFRDCLLYTSPSPRDRTRSRMPSSA